jgi:3-phosphoshikimate 1-carboxyvinyltransferase
MAMSFAPLALVYDGIEIRNPEVVSKSYIGFWEDLKSAGFSVNLRH